MCVKERKTRVWGTLELHGDGQLSSTVFSASARIVPVCPRVPVNRQEVLLRVAART